MNDQPPAGQEQLDDEYHRIFEIIGPVIREHYWGHTDSACLKLIAAIRSAFASHAAPALTGEAYFIDREMFMRYINDHVQPARLKEGIAVLSERSCEVSYDIIKQGRYGATAKAT